MGVWDRWLRLVGVVMLLMMIISSLQYNPITKRKGQRYQYFSCISSHRRKLYNSNIESNDGISCSAPYAETVAPLSTLRPYRNHRL